MNILENNKLIAEFMRMKKIDGFTTSLSGMQVSASGYEHDGEFVLLEDLQFHSSWDWLMPVVDKIHNTGVVTDICFGYDMGYFTIEAETEQETRMFEGHQNHGKPIDCVYKAVIEFMQWYNEQPSNS